MHLVDDVTFCLLSQFMKNAIDFPSLNFQKCNIKYDSLMIMFEVVINIYLGENLCAYITFWRKGMRK